MDSGDAKGDQLQTRRRSARQASKTVSGLYQSKDLTRLPIKRTRGDRKENESPSAVNGSTSPAEGDDESPAKIARHEEAENVGNENGSGDGLNHTDDAEEEMEMEENAEQDQDMNSDEEAEQDADPLDKKHSDSEEVLERILRSRRSIHIKSAETESPTPKTGHTANYSSNTTNKEPKRLVAAPIQLEPRETQQEFLKNRSYKNYQGHTENIRDPNRTLILGGWNRHQPSESHNIRVCQTNFPINKKLPTHKNTESKKPVISKASPASTSRGFAWYVCKLLQWSLMLIGLLAVGLLGYQKFTNSSMPRTDVVRPEILEKFNVTLSALQRLFPSQHSLFWTRSGKHLKGHLQTAEPTEPVSLILTSGLKAERTLGCIARSLAAAYSATLNASILEIYGTSKTAQDSDQVKLDIDKALQEAFGGNKPAAVIHRFEELPPGSTLIFYRYCDHENAAFKRALLAFTVMLSEDKIDPAISLSEVENKVHDMITEKFIPSNKSALFNQMDVDKLSGLWSRISHLILPVAAEEKIEQQGCEV